MNQVQWQEQREREQKEGAALFAKLAPASAIYAVVYVVCLYENRAGLLSVLWAFATVGFAWYAVRMGRAEKKRGSVLLSAVMLLVGTSTFLTGNEWVILMNYGVIFFLLVSFLVYQMKPEPARGRDFGDYAAEFFKSVWRAVCGVFAPFSEGNAYLEQRKGDKKGKGHYVLLGIGIAVPCLLVLGGLLMSADMVFQKMVLTMFSEIRVPARVIRIAFMLLFGFFSSYCGVRYFLKSRNEVENAGERGNGEPVLAITVMSVIAALYVAFCAIQVVYLFIGGMRLPAGVTYAEYARSGFFQLLFVCVLNLIAVLSVKKFFKKHRALDVILTVVSACTLVMTVSSALRMLLYIRAYHLTFLRVGVLLALAVIAALMVGVTVSIWRASFPLLRFGTAVVCAAYLGLAFSHADYFIASYNLAHLPENGGDYGYLSSLSTDAAPAVAAYLGEHPALENVGEYSTNWYAAYCRGCEGQWENMTLRGFNLSYYVAGKLLG